MCAVGDLVTFLMFGSASYVLAFWIYSTIKGLMLIWLACSICGMFVAENRKSVTMLSAAIISLGAASLVIAMAFTGETLKEILLDGEIAANFILLGMIFLGWLGRRDKLTAEWKWITAGFMLMVGGDLLFTLLWYFWDGARHWYPVSTIGAQLIWAISPLIPHRLCHARADLGQRIQDTERISVC